MTYTVSIRAPKGNIDVLCKGCMKLVAPFGRSIKVAFVHTYYANGKWKSTDIYHPVCLPDEHRERTSA